MTENFSDKEESKEALYNEENADEICHSFTYDVKVYYRYLRKNFSKFIRKHISKDIKTILYVPVKIIQKNFLYK